MHEWAVAESIVLTVIQEAEKNNLKSLERITLRIGELQKMEKDILCFAMESLFKDQGYNISRDSFLIYEEPAVFKCNFCGNSWAYAEALNHISEEEKEFIHFIPEVAHGFLKCSSCGSADFELEKGRGVIVESIIGETC
ncbi:MAG: hydrogenase nickel incorporation protein HypA [Deltaproteobacteria bacterium]|nr:hydrogenase nickel incorporation protein HypA [Deltaproteobacteria bacterium]